MAKNCMSCGSILNDWVMSCPHCAQREQYAAQDRAAASARKRAEEKAAAKQATQRAEAARRQEQKRLKKQAKQRKKQTAKPSSSLPVSSQKKWSWIAAMLGGILGAVLTISVIPESNETYAPLIAGGLSSLLVGRFWRGILIACALLIAALIAIRILNQ